jgi:hypothetical protein
MRNTEEEQANNRESTHRGPLRNCEPQARIVPVQITWHGPPQCRNERFGPVSGLASSRSSPSLETPAGRGAFPCLRTVACCRVWTRLPLRGQRRHCNDCGRMRTGFPFNPSSGKLSGHLKRARSLAEKFFRGNAEVAGEMRWKRQSGWRKRPFDLCHVDCEPACRSASPHVAAPRLAAVAVAPGAGAPSDPGPARQLGDSSARWVESSHPIPSHHSDPRSPWKTSS